MVALDGDVVLSYKHLGQGVGAGARDVRLAGVERHRVDRLLELLAVRRDLLHARLAVQVPQPDGAVVAWRQDGGVNCYELTVMLCEVIMDLNIAGRFNFC